MAKAKAKEVRHEGRRLAGMSIAIKLALVTAGLVVLFMLAFSLVLGRFVRDAVKHQIRVAAHAAACVAASAPFESWSEYFGSPWQGLTSEQINQAAAAMSQGQYEAAFRSAEAMTRSEWNRRRLERLLKTGTRLQAVEIVALGEGSRTLVASSYGASGDTRFEAILGQAPLDVPEGDAREGVLVIGGRELHVIRGSCPIRDRDGLARGEVVVYISAGAVNEATGSLTAQVVLFAIGFVAVGAGVAFAVGRQLMRPLRLLAEDVRVVAEGDLEHRTEARSRDEIGELARRFDHMTQQLAAAAASERETAAGRHQMAVAAEVAASLFPARLPSIAGFDVAGHHETSGQLAGEYYDVLEMPGGRWGFLVASASGTGVPAAMVMAMARSFLAALARKESDPGAILRDANALLSGDLRRGMYVTVLLVVLDPASATLTVANAGHAPLLLGREGKIAPVHSEGIALGFDKGPVFDSTLRVVRLPLQPGDRVVLYTPGVTRVNGADGEPLGEERFAALVRREAGHPAAAFVQRMAALIRKFRGETPLTEGVTLLTLGRLGEQGGNPT